MFASRGQTVHVHIQETEVQRGWVIEHKVGMGGGVGVSDLCGWELDHRGLRAPLKALGLPSECIGGHSKGQYDQISLLEKPKIWRSSGISHLTHWTSPRTREEGVPPTMGHHGQAGSTVGTWP